MRAVLQRYREHQDLLWLGFSIFFGTTLLCVAFLRLPLVLSGLIAMTLAVSITVAFDRLLTAYWRKQCTQLRIGDHPDFGQVRVLASHWEAKISGHPFLGEIDVSGEGAAIPPSDIQTALFLKIRDQFDTLLTASLHSLKEHLDAGDPRPDAINLRLDGIHLGPDNGPPSFSLTFHPNSDISQTLFVDFIDFQVEESGWAH